MKLIDYAIREDFGKDFYFFFFKTEKYTLIQVSVGWYDYPSWPYLQIKSGSGDVLSILFWAYKFGFDIDVLSRTWNWDYLEKMNEDETELV